MLMLKSSNQTSSSLFVQIIFQNIVFMIPMLSSAIAHTEVPGATITTIDHFIIHQNCDIDCFNLGKNILRRIDMSE